MKKKINYKILFETFLKNKHPYNQHWICKVGGKYVMQYCNNYSSWIYVLGSNKKIAIVKMKKIFIKGEE